MYSSLFFLIFIPRIDFICSCILELQTLTKRPAFCLLQYKQLPQASGWQMVTTIPETEKNPNQPKTRPEP